MTVSKFLQSGKTYLNEAVSYLEKRGLTIQDLPIVPYKNANLGFFVKDSDGFTPLILEGWAIQIKDQGGELYEDRWLLRVMNWPTGDLFQKSQGKICAVAGAPPKFIQIATKGADITNFISTAEELCHSDIVMFHEKSTSAALARQLTNLPCLALSGCHNWSSDGKLKENIADIIRLMRPDTHIVVCFDGDIVENPNVMYAASQLKGWVATIREDITMTFPLVPPMTSGNGWDDFLVEQGPNAGQVLLELIENEGVDVTSALPIQYLISKFQVKVRVGRDKVSIEHTAENYRRLMKHRLWKDYVMDVGGGIYDPTLAVVQRWSMDDFMRKYEMWLADSPFSGDGANVASGKVKQAVKEEMIHRIVSIPMALLAAQPPVTRQQAQEAATRLIEDGIRVLGPMQPQETVETLLRVSRDMVALWSGDHSVDVQWAIALVGPSGCGKSNFTKSFTKCLVDWGYGSTVAQLAKEGSKANIDELFRACRDNLIGQFDEYNPDDRSAKTVEQNLFTLSTTRVFNQRRLHEEDSTESLRRASIFLTTTDRNKTYVRSAKGTGERRFITLEVQGTKMYGGKLSSNRDIVAECGRILLVHGYQMFMENYPGDATEFSATHTDQYVTEMPITSKVANIWAGREVDSVLAAFGTAQYRKSTEDVRFSPAQGQGLLMGSGGGAEELTRQERSDINLLMIELGAKEVGKARVNTADGDTMKDKVFVVDNWDAWCLALHARLS